MATYKYQQNLYDGAAAGYVKYNITPAIGTRVSPGEKVTISGQAYCRDKKIYGVGVSLGVGDVWEDPESFRGFEVAQKKVTIAKGSTGTFSLSFALTEEDMSELGDLSERAFTAQIEFSLYDSSDLTGGEVTTQVASQKVSLLKYREAPVIQSAEFSDATGAESVFGGFVQGQSIFKMTMQAQTDPLDSKVTIASRTLTLDGTKHSLSSDAQEVGTLAKSGVVDWTLKVTDSKGLSVETSGSISLIPYSPPVIESLTAFRYKEMISDDGSISYVAADDGEQVWFSLAGTVTPVSEKNAWTLTVEWDGKSSVVRSGEDGTGILLTDDRDAVTESISAIHRMEFTWTLADYFTSVVMRTAVEKASAYFNVEQNGVAVGMRSTGTPDEKKFEVAEDYDSHFYGTAQFQKDVSVGGKLAGAAASFSGTLSASGTATLKDSRGKTLTGGELVKDSYVTDVSVASSTDVKKTVLTAPVTGLYIITVFASWASNATGRRAIAIVDGDGETHLSGARHYAHSTSAIQQNATGIAYLTKGQTVKLLLWQNSGSTLTASYFTRSARIGA